MVQVATLVEVSLRDVWENEARDFTPWLAENPDLLGKELGMDLELEGEEVDVGTFSADLVFRDTANGWRVVVENMLETTDHDHLGKLITYAAAFEARWAVLISKEFRPEHRTALNWLNSISGEDSGFFGIEVHAVRILESPIAIRLDIVVKPDDFSRRAQAEAKTVSKMGKRYIEWWTEFLPEFHEAHPGWSNRRKPSYANWLTFPSGKGGVRYGLSFSRPTGASNYHLSAHVHISDSESAYPALERLREIIEAQSAFELRWDPGENKQSAQIETWLDPADPTDRNRWPEYRAWAIEALAELRRIFGQPIKNLP